MCHIYMNLSRIKASAQLTTFVMDSENTTKKQHSKINPHPVINFIQSLTHNRHSLPKIPCPASQRNLNLKSDHFVVIRGMGLYRKLDLS